MNKLLTFSLISAVTISLNVAQADQSQIAGSLLRAGDPSLTGDLVRNGVAIFAPELNQILALQLEGRAIVEITPIGYTYKCIDPVNPCVIR